MDKADERKRIDQLLADNKAALEAAQESANKGDWQYFEKVPMDKAEQPTITQADRDAAAERLTSPFDGSPVEATQEMIRAGKLDAHPWVQAFARHRTTSLAAQGYVCANCEGMIGELASGRDPEELCDTCYEDSQAAQEGLVEALDDATLDEIILNFAGGVVQVPSEHNPRGYVSYYRPREAMRKALSAIKEQHHD